jgi:hypothetical protein
VDMDLEVLKKKLSTYRNGRGQVRNVNDDLLMEVLSAWEQWTGPTSGFSVAIGVSPNGISSIIGKAKKLRRDGFPTDQFKEVTVVGTQAGDLPPCNGIEVVWDGGKLIRFVQVDHLIDFLKKVA